LESSINSINKRIFSLFQTDIESVLKNKFEWMVQHNIDTLVINSWFYWEYEQLVKLLNERNKEESEQRKKQEETESSKYSGLSNFNPSKIMGGFGSSSGLKNFGGMGNNSAFPRI